MACWLRDHGVTAGDRVLVVLDARRELWETLLASLKLGAVVVPCHTGLTAPELADRIRRGGVRHIVCTSQIAQMIQPDDLYVTPGTGPSGPRVLPDLHVAVGNDVPPGWHPFPGPDQPDRPFLPERPTPASAVAFCYFTSGTTSLPKLVAHTHISYPVGHLSSMYWNGLLPGDRHMNISSPGWAKHSWSSLFVPWNAEATVVSAHGAPVPAADLPGLLADHRVNSLCAPPSTWKALLSYLDTARPLLREATSAGEPLDPKVADQIERAWAVRPRDGYGQTETTALIGTTPGQVAPPGSVGRPLPGYQIVLRDGSGPSSGEICIDLGADPVGVMAGYLDSSAAAPVRRADPDGPALRTGDLAESDDGGWIRLLGRRDDMFKSFDLRISPLELEAALATHPRVLEVAVIPVPDPVGGFVPHAVVVPRPGTEPGPCLERELLQHAASCLAEGLRPRSISFARDLPRTVTGKMHRACLRAATGQGETGQGEIAASAR